MASLYKPLVTTIDQETGEKIKEKNKMWYGRYRDAEGIERRLRLSENKAVAQQMLAKLTDESFRIKNGLMHPGELEMKQPIEKHLADFENSLKSRNNTAPYVRDCLMKIWRCVKECRWKTPSHIQATDVERFLVGLRERCDYSVETSNHYLRAIKGFVHWLYLNKRIVDNPLLSLSILNNRIDRRHDRRALRHDELMRLIDAAVSGPPVEGLTGPERAMLYMLAAWTGFRKAELGSLTTKSFQLDCEVKTVTIEAAYSKHRRKDVQVLHPDLAARLKRWLALKKPGPDEILFPVSDRSGGVDRKTSKMIRFDLNAARTFWTAESETEEEETIRLHADYLLYRDENGHFADFHCLRHTFITNLCRANVSPKTAQSLARHCDIKLTLGIYTHVDQDEQIAVINSLPSLEPPKNDKE